jgi:hypothetical protein
MGWGDERRHSNGRLRHAGAPMLTVIRPLVACQAVVLRDHLEDWVSERLQLLLECGLQHPSMSCTISRRTTICDLLKLSLTADWPSYNPGMCSTPGDIIESPCAWLIAVTMHAAVKATSDSMGCVNCTRSNEPRKTMPAVAI